MDAYVKQNRLSLEAFHDNGDSPFHGVSRRTLRAFARRGLVWYDQDDSGRWTGGLTDKGRAALAELEDHA